MIVSDTTLPVHYALPFIGDDTTQAHTLFDGDPDWRAPPLWASETRDALLGYVRAGRMMPGQAIGAAVSLEGIVTAEPVGHAEVPRPADALGSSAHDAEYAALAARLGVPMVTSDRRLREAVPGALDPASVGGG